MQSLLRLIFALMVTSSALAAKEAAATGYSIQKVIDMLNDMVVKGTKEMQQEQIEYAKFSESCTNGVAAFKKQIAMETETIETLTAELGALEVEIEELAGEIAKLKADEVKFSADLKAQEDERAETHQAFLTEQTDYEESVSALERAIVVMQKRDYDIPGESAAVLLQLQDEKSKLPAKAKYLIGSFTSMVQNDVREFLSEPPEANAYDFQSTGIINMLKKLLDEFRAKLTECQKAEMNSVHAFNMIAQDLRDSIKNAKTDSAEKSTHKAQKEEKVAKSKKALSISEDSKVKQEKLLQETVADCEDETTFYTDKQRVRKQELEALGQAIKILTSEPMNTGKKYIDLNQIHSKAPVLAQLRSTTGTEGIRLRIRQFLTAEGERLHSKRIAFLAQKIAADPFAKVTKMIDEMITRLEEEAHADADHEGFCDEEMGKSKVTRDKLSSEIDQLTAAIEDGKATINKLAREIAELTKEIAEVQQSETVATELRKANKKANEVTIAESQDAQKAVEAAIAVLKKFYEGAVTPVPRKFEDSGKMGSPEWQQLANPNFDSSAIKDKPITYTGQQDFVGGVFALLEVILSDFANVEAEATAEETTMKAKYEEFMVECKKSIEVKSKKIEMSTADKAEAETAVESQTADLKGTQDELIAANKYYERLVPQCVDQGMTFEERTNARAEEIASLKQALQLLDARTTF